MQGFVLFLAVSYFVQGLADLSSGLAQQPVLYLLKEGMNLSAAQVGFFFALIGLGWALKPLYGLLSDLYPFAGLHRKSYLLCMSALGTGSWLALALLPPGYTSVLLLLTFCAATLAFCDVMIDALMVATGRPHGLTGSFQAVQWMAISLAFSVAQLGGGYLATYAEPHQVFLLSASFPLATFLVTLGCVREPRRQGERGYWRDAGMSLWQAAHSRRLWLVMGFLFFWNFSPSLGTPLVYYQVDVLRFSKVFVGTLGAILNAAGILGALVFLVSCRTTPLDTLLYRAIGLGVAATLSFLGLSGPKTAVVLFLIFGAISQFTHLAVLDLAARSCPARAEGTVFALLMSSLNLGRAGATFVGGWLYDYGGLTVLILVSAACTALCGALVPLLHLRRAAVLPALP